MSRPPEVRWTPTVRDHVALARLVGRRWTAQRLVLYTALLAGFLGAALMQVQGSASLMLAVYIGLLWGSLVVSLVLRPRIAVYRSRRASPSRVLLVEHRLSLHPWGALLEVDGARQSLPWDQVGEPRARGGYLLLSTPPRGGVLVPRWAFADDEALGGFASEVRELRLGECADGPRDPVLADPERWGSWSLELELTEADYQALARDALARRVRARWLLAVAGLALMACFGVTAALPDGEVLLVLGLVVGAFLVVRGTRRWWLALLLPGRVRRVMSRHPERFPVGPAALWVGPAGVVGRLGSAWHRVPWRHVLEVVGGRHHLFVYLSATEAFIVPYRALGADVEAAEAQWRAWTEAAPRGEPAVATMRPPSDAPDPFAPPGEG